jgi:hypothetical protein
MAQFELIKFIVGIDSTTTELDQPRCDEIAMDLARAVVRRHLKETGIEKLDIKKAVEYPLGGLLPCGNASVRYMGPGTSYPTDKDGWKLYTQNYTEDPYFYFCRASSRVAGIWVGRVYVLKNPRRPEDGCMERLCNTIPKE